MGGLYLQEMDSRSIFGRQNVPSIYWLQPEVVIQVFSFVPRELLPPGLG